MVLVYYHGLVEMMEGISVSPNERWYGGGWVDGCG